MKEQCFEFRSRLSALLNVDPAQQGKNPEQTTFEGMQSLEWHSHLLHCAECRQLLEGEQLLEELLGSLPDPVLSKGARAQLVQRLQESMRVERLLDAADPFV
ncbi:MAG: hypothetical protein KDB61_08925, partial [Planctomycetes bacterium]|nr:hypothetical protein [Planctomycetota bacterium]